MRVQRVRIKIYIGMRTSYYFDYTTLLPYKISEIQVKQIKNVR